MYIHTYVQWQKDFCDFDFENACPSKLLYHIVYCIMCYKFMIKKSEFDMPKFIAKIFNNGHAEWIIKHGEPAWAMCATISVLYFLINENQIVLLVNFKDENFGDDTLTTKTTKFTCTYHYKVTSYVHHVQLVWWLHKTTQFLETCTM